MRCTGCTPYTENPPDHSVGMGEPTPTDHHSARCKHARTMAYLYNRLYTNAGVVKEAAWDVLGLPRADEYPTAVHSDRGSDAAQSLGYPRYPADARRKADRRWHHRALATRGPRECGSHGSSPRSTPAAARATAKDRLRVISPKPSPRQVTHHAPPSDPPTSRTAAPRPLRADVLWVAALLRRVSQRGHDGSQRRGEPPWHRAGAGAVSASRLPTPRGHGMSTLMPQPVLSGTHGNHNRGTSCETHRSGTGSTS